MSALDEVLRNAQRARLIPVVADSRREERTVSVLLAAAPATRALAKWLLRCCEARTGKTWELRCYTEVEFPAPGDGGAQRADGVLRLSTRTGSWSALLEAKVDGARIDDEQLRRYAEVARAHGVDAVLTLSNQLVALPAHVPYAVPKKFGKSVRFFHLSWISVLTQASLILRDLEGVDPEQAFVLREVVRYLEHPSSGVRRFDRMNPEWRPLVRGIRNQRSFHRASPEVENAVASWFQLERDICLMLGRRLNARIDVRLSRKHSADPSARFRDACDALAATQTLRSALVVPNAAGDFEMDADLPRRTIACSMKLSAPRDRKTASGRTNWLLRQLRGVAGDDVIVRAFWPGAQKTQALLSEVQADVGRLAGERAGAAPTSFELAMIRDLAGRCEGPKTFVEELKALAPEYYDRIGQRLRRWIPPPPPIEPAAERAQPPLAAGPPTAPGARPGDGADPPSGDGRPA